MTWKDQVEKRYFWARIKDQLDELTYELAKAEDEENVELSLLGMHLGDSSNMVFFTDEERRHVHEQLSLVRDETAKHIQLLNQAVEKLKERPG